MWPWVLGKELDCVIHDYAFSGLSNDVIASSVVYGVERLLSNGVNANEILVGIMWSGVDRISFFKQSHTTEELKNSDKYNMWKENYSFIIKDDFPINKNIDPRFSSDCKDYSFGSYSVQNFSYDTPDALAWYQNLHDPLGARITTFEKIVWLQDYLKQKNVDYFMSTFMDSVLEPDKADLSNAATLYNEGDEIKIPHLEWLKSHIDFDYFLPIRSYHTFFAGQSEYKRHPDTQENEDLVHKVILPFLSTKYTNTNK